MTYTLVDAVREEAVLRGNTPQGLQADPRQVQNSAGGWTFTVNDKDRLDRFLILGATKGTYYIKPEILTKQNTDFVRKMVRENEQLLVDTAVDVSVQARAYSNSAAIFALAVALVEGDNKAYTRAAILRVARTSTHIFELAEYIKNLGGWGRAKREAIAAWYEMMNSAGKLPYQVVKYRQRNGWTHRDLLRLAHPKGLDQNVVNFVLGKPSEGATDPVIIGFKTIQSQTDLEFVLNNLELWPELPWEAIPTQFLNEPEVWKKLFYNNQLNGQALVRNITRLARINAFNDLRFAADYAERLTDVEMIRKTRLHPVNFLNALVVHEEGQVDRSGYAGWFDLRRKPRDWETSGVIRDALNEGFHLAFGTVESANKRTVLAVDVSGSMSQAALGLDLSCAQVSAAVAMTIARTEPAYMIMGFSSNFVNLDIGAKDSLASAMRKVNARTFGGTDVALPMNWALKNGVEVDTFGVITDNETWAGRNHPHQALKNYRQETGIPARLAVLGVAATDFTVADPEDKGMMDFVGFDANAPRALADFSAGRI
jgi:60 kDa SS-A/Ro ribonucleoprotein